MVSDWRCDGACGFWAAQGDTVPAGAKQPNPKDVEAARALMKDAKKRELQIIIPTDTNLGFDIGPRPFKDLSKCSAVLELFSGTALSVGLKNPNTQSELSKSRARLLKWML